MDIMAEIVMLEPKTGDYDADLFAEFVTKMVDKKKHAEIFKQEVLFDVITGLPIEEKKTTTKKAGAANWNEYIKGVKFGQRNPRTDDVEANKLIGKYLMHFCEIGKGSLAAFRDPKYEFEESFLKNAERQVRILQATNGLASLTDEDEVTPQMFKAVADQVWIKFAEKNQENFEVQEEVVLETTVKNITKLEIKIYEFNTETYYMKHKAEFKDTINLEGLEASESLQFNYEFPANVKHTEHFTFPQLTDKIGLFIIEFIGNGICARAIIKKGTLTLI